MPDKKLWAYIAKLEKVIKSTMESSEEISALVEKIQQQGIEVSLNCIALFSDPQGRSFTAPGASKALRAARGKAAPGKKKRATKPKGKPATAGKRDAKHEFKVTDADREFLRQIGIRFD